MADAEGDLSKRHGTRVFKKSSPNGKVFFFCALLHIVRLRHTYPRGIFWIILHTSIQSVFTLISKYICS